MADGTTYHVTDNGTIIEYQPGWTSSSGTTYNTREEAEAAVSGKSSSSSSTTSDGATDTHSAYREENEQNPFLLGDDGVNEEALAESDNSLIQSKFKDEAAAAMNGESGKSQYETWKDYAMKRAGVVSNDGAIAANARSIDEIQKDIDETVSFMERATDAGVQANLQSKLDRLNQEYAESAQNAFLSDSEYSRMTAQQNSLLPVLEAQEKQLSIAGTNLKGIEQTYQYYAKIISEYQQAYSKGAYISSDMVAEYNNALDRMQEIAADWQARSAEYNSKATAYNTNLNAYQQATQALNNHEAATNFLRNKSEDNYYNALLNIGYATDVESGTQAAASLNAAENEYNKFHPENQGSAAWALEGMFEQGAGQVVGSVASLVDALFGGAAQEVHTILNQTLGGVLGDTNVITALNNYVQESNKREGEFYSKNAQELGAGWQTADKYGTMVAAALPAAALAIMTAGTSATATGLAGVAGTTGALTSYASAMGEGKAAQTMALIGQSVMQMMKDPNWQGSFVQESGNAYQEALNENATPAEATVYSLLYGFASATIEVGGTSEILGGIQKLPEEIQQAIAKGEKSEVLDYAKSIVSEMGEEITQGMTEAGLKGIYTSDVGLYGTGDDNAIINPTRMAEEAKGAAVVSSILGGGQIATEKILTNAPRENATSDTDSEAENKSEAKVSQRVEANPVTNELKTEVTAQQEPQIAKTSAAVQPTEIQNILAKGAISNAQAEAIITNPILKAQFEQEAGITLGGSKSEQRAQIKSAVNAQVEEAATPVSGIENAETAEEAPAASEQPVAEVRSGSTNEPQTVAPAKQPEAAHIENALTSPQNPLVRSTPKVNEGTAENAENRRSGELNSNTPQGEGLTELNIGHEGRNLSNPGALDNAAYDSMVQERGAIAPGETPARDVSIPKSTDNGNVSQTVRTVAEAKATSERRLSEIKSAVFNGDFSFEADTNEAQKARAEKQITDLGWHESVKEWTAAVRSGKTSADLVAMGATLLDNFGNTDNVSTEDYLSVLNDYVQLIRHTAQAEQATRILKTMSPTARLFGIQKTVSNYNEDRRSKIDRKGVKEQAAENANNAVVQTVSDAVRDVSNELNSTAKTAGSETREIPQKQASNEIRRATRKEVEGVTADEIESNVVNQLDLDSDFAKEVATKVTQSVVRGATAETKTAEKTAVDQAVATLMRFVREKMPKRTSNRTNTAIDVLREYIASPEMFTQAYEGAQVATAITLSSNPEALGRVDGFVKEGIGINNTAAPKTIFNRAIAEAAARANESTSLIRQQAAVGMSPEEIGTHIFNSIAHETGLVTGAGATAFEAELAPTIQEACRNYAADVINSANTDVNVENIVRSALKDVGDTLDNLARNGMNGGTYDAITRVLVNKYGIDGIGASEIANTVQNELSRLVQEKSKSILNQKFGERKPKSKEQRALAQELTEMVNLGTFDSEYAAKATEKLFGIRDISINKALLNNFMNAQDDTARNAAIDAIRTDVASQVGSTLGEKITALRYLNMLGNLKTVNRNLFGNVAMGVQAWAKRQVAEGITAAARAAGANVEQMYRNGYGIDRLKVAAADCNGETYRTAKGEKKYGNVYQQLQSEIQDKRQIWKTDSSNPLIKGINKGMNLYTKAVDTLMNDWGDGVFIRATYADSLAGYMKAHGISAAQWTEMVQNPTAENQRTVDAARNYAIKESQEATFRQNSKAAQLAASFDANFQRFGFIGDTLQVITRGLAPMRKTPANVAVNMEEYSPLGVFNTAVMAAQKAAAKTKLADMEGVLGDIARAGDSITDADIINQLSKTLTGTGLFMLGIALKSAGILHVGSDDDDEKNAYEKAIGIQDNSITVGGKNISISWLTPSAAPILMGGYAYGLMGDGDITGDELVAITNQFLETIIDSSMLSGVNDALNNISQYDDTESAAGQFILNAFGAALTQVFTNSFVGQLESGMEDYRQTVYTNPDGALPTSVQKKLAQATAKIPGVDFQNADSIDQWGRKQSNGNKLLSVLNATLNPATVTDLDQRGTAIDDWLLGIHDSLEGVEGANEVLPGYASRSTEVNGTRLSEEEYETFATERGQTRLEMLTTLYESPLSSQMTAEELGSAISSIYTYTDQLAKRNIAEARGEEFNAGDELRLSSGDTPVSQANIPIYMAYNSLISSALDEEAPDYERADSALAELQTLPQDVQDAIIEHKTGLHIKDLLEYANAGIGSEDYMAVYNATKAAMQERGSTSVSGMDKWKGLLTSGLDDDAIEAIINNIDYLNTNAQKVVEIFEKYGYSLKDAYNFMGLADGYVSVYNGEVTNHPADGKLTNLEASHALDMVDFIDDNDKRPLYAELREIFNQPWAINDWKDYSYESEVAYAKKMIEKYGNQYGSSTFKTLR